jgi:hypothetical protein
MRRAGLSLCSSTYEATAVCSSSRFLARSAFASAFWIEVLAALLAQGGRDRRDLIEGSVASSHRQNSEDSDAGYPESECRGDGKMMAAAAD